MSDIINLPDNFIGKEDKEKLKSFGGHTIALGRATLWHWAKDEHGGDVFEIYRGTEHDILTMSINRDRELDAFCAIDEDGKMIGYTLQPGRDKALFSEMGLQPGDVVTRVNEVDLSDISSGMRALKSAEGGDSVSLTVMRGGQEQQLSINVPQ